jgi:hypothetical protein
MRLFWVVALCAMCVICGCGTPGAPQPPSLELPRPVRDLRAQRKGDRVTLTWTVPRNNMDRTVVKHLGPSRICRTTGRVSEMTDCPTSGEVSPDKVNSGRATFTDVIPKAVQQSNPHAFFTYAIETFNTRGRTVGPGNTAHVPTAPTLPPPDKLQTETAAKGVVISWIVPLNETEALGGMHDGLKYEFHVFRRNPKTPDAPRVEIPTTKAYASPTLPQPNLNVLDTTIEWEQEYVYWTDIRTIVLGSGGEEIAHVDGDDSPPVTVLAHDIFPPAVPEGLQAVFSGLEQRKFVDLSWNAGTESDMAGYNIYRTEDGGAPVKINIELVKTPAFRDMNVQSGHRYFYSLTAVDLRGNESARSAVANETVP